MFVRTDLSLVCPQASVQPDNAYQAVTLAVVGVEPDNAYQAVALAVPLAVAVVDSFFFLKDYIRYRGRKKKKIIVQNFSVV